MAPVQILFILIAAATLGTALMVVTARNLVHSALYLVATLFGVAILFVLLNAGFLAIAQVVVYIGAIAILIIFAIMLTRRLAQDRGSQINNNWFWAAILAGLMFAGLAWMLNGWSGFTSQAAPLSPHVDQVSQLGKALVSPDAYVLPFELASVLLLAALIGAIVIAWEKK